MSFASQRPAPRRRASPLAQQMRVAERRFEHTLQHTRFDQWARAPVYPAGGAATRLDADVLLLRARESLQGEFRRLGVPGGVGCEPAAVGGGGGQYEHEHEHEHEHEWEARSFPTAPFAQRDALPPEAPHTLRLGQWRARAMLKVRMLVLVVWWSC